MVIIDRLTKVAYFLSIRSSYTVASMSHIFMEQIVRLHGIPRWIILDPYLVFTSALWTTLQHDLGAQLNFSLAYHPETDGQIERVNRMLEDMLRMYVMDQ